MDSRNFEALTDAEINRWAVLHDEKLFGDWRFDERCVHNYAKSADATLALCERWGLKLNLLKQHPTDHWLARMDGQPYNSLGPTASRSITNAACAARHAKEMADG